jgi:SAM-dependent methyltransferase
VALGNDSDRDWKVWGDTDPYFGVLTDPKFLNANLTDNSLQEFFTSGELHVDHVYSVIRTTIRPGFQPARVLDYGCGVGRLVVAFARRAQAVVGIDVSPSMLSLAREHCSEFPADSVCLQHVDEFDALEPGSFDLVHSFLVLQHIPVDRGELIIKKLVTLLGDRGIGAIHLPYSDSRKAFHRSLSSLRKHVKPVHGLLNLAAHRPYSAPHMQMNCYSMNRIFDILSNTNCSNLHVELSGHSGLQEAMIYFEKSAPPTL